jgi:peptide/nickel transport system substrate-binding protein
MCCTGPAEPRKLYSSLAKGTAMTTAKIRGLLSALLLATTFAGSAVVAPQASAQQKTLKFVPEADLRILDPIATTAYITRNYAYMVYDTLFSVNEKFEVQPQMVEKWTLSDDKLTYTFTLRDGLKFHDGAAVKSADCIASIERWAKRDALGQRLAEMTEKWTVVDDKTFTLKLKRPFALTLDALGKPSSNVPFIMPERVAKTDAFENIKDTIGSGPFKFVKEEWVPGNKVVFVKNTDYVPRKEPPSWASGGKVVKVDRVEWIYIPDSATAAAALNAGEVDWWQMVPPDLVPLLTKNKDIKVENTDPMGSMGMIRFNQLHPPFNNPKMRQALLYVVNQMDYALAIAGDAKNGRACPSLFSCGSPSESKVGSEILTGKRDVEKAKALVKEAGYKGEKVVVLSATDQPIVHSQGLITVELLKSIGVNAELAANDWGTLISRRAVREPIDKGGWNIFHTWLVGPDMANPAINYPLRGIGEKSWFGWPTDPKMEELRNAWFDAPDAATQKKLVDDMQRHGWDSVPIVPTAQFVVPTAYRSNISGLLISPIAFLWNVEKK